MTESLYPSKVKFTPDKDIPDLSGKVVLVTGGNVGLGKETIAQLAKHNPKLIFLAARTESKALNAIADIKNETPKANIEYLPLDLTSLQSVASAVDHVKSRTDRLDILINNAGIMNLPFSLTKDGYEIQFGTNHMGHALLTKLLMPLLLHTAGEIDSDVRVVNLSSTAHAFALASGGVITNTNWRANFTTGVRYGSSKLANLLHARALAERYPQLTATSVHPGVIDTQLFDATMKMWHGVPLIGASIAGIIQGSLKPVAGGALNQLWAATAPKEQVRQAYYFVPVGQKNTGWLSGKKGADALWEWTEAELTKHGY